MADAQTKYKLIILYMLRKVTFPLSNSQITEFMIEKEYTDYFHIQEALNDLVDSKLIVLDQIRNTTQYEATLDGEKTLEGIEGRIAELDILIRPADPDTPYRNFVMYFARNEKYYSILSYRPRESWLQIDRKFSGSRRAYIHQRRCLVPDRHGEIHLHVILDRFSVEVFINDGEQVMTATMQGESPLKRTERPLWTSQNTHCLTGYKK